MFMHLVSDNVKPKAKEKFGPNKKFPVVYCFCDENDNMLYVGKTSNFCSRWSQHVRSAKPMEKIKSVHITMYKTMSEACFMEAQLIAGNRPDWNVQGKDELVSDIDIKPIYYFSLKVLTKTLTEFRRKMHNDIIDWVDITNEQDRYVTQQH